MSICTPPRTKIALVLRQAPLGRARGRLLGLLVTVVLSAAGRAILAAPTSYAIPPEPATTPSPPLGTSLSPFQGEGADRGRSGGVRVAQRIKFERISIEQGLSQNSVHCILQDSRGFMWFGTWDGLNKYDGHSFTVYRHDLEDPDSLSNNIVRSIYEDRSGALWIGTQGGGLDRFDRETGRFAHYQNDPGDPHSLSGNIVWSIHEDRSGVLWIGTSAGLNRFDRETGRFVRYQHDPGDPHSLSHDSILSIYEDWSGVLWIGTGGGGLNEFDRENGRFAHYRNDPGNPHSLAGNVVRSIYEDQSGELWIGTYYNGLDRFERESAPGAGAGQFIHYQHTPDDPNSLSDDRVRSIYEDQSGVLWIGTYYGGLDRLDRENDQFIHYRNNPNDPYSLSDDRVWSVYEDRSGVLWIGTNRGGLCKSDRSTERFVHYQHDPNNPNGLSSNDVSSVYEDHLGVLWVGTYSGGLNRLIRETERFVHYRNEPSDPYSLSSDVVVSICEDRSGVLWIGTSGGLNKFDRTTGRFERYQYDPSDPHSLSDNRVAWVHEDQSGTLWVGTYGGGLNRFDRETERFSHYQDNPDDPNSLNDTLVRSIHEDEFGMLWIGTDDGLSRFYRDSEQFTRYRRYRNAPNDPASLSNNWVSSIYEDRSGVLWIGTNGGGLNKFDPGREAFTHYREKDGLPNDVICGILEDDQGFLWISTNRGLSKFDPRTETFKNYDARDGLQSNEFIGNACHKSSSGEMFFGGVNGLTAFSPQNVQDNAYVPPVVLTSLTQGGEEVDAGQAVESVTEVTFHWPHNFFEFEFAALSYSQPPKNQHAYMLNGFDKDWNYIGTRRFGRYTNLPGGTYTLRMIGSNNDGVWNEEGTLLRITIVPPFWATWWFRTIAALALVGGAIGGYWLRVRSIQARSRELETQVRQRTSEIERRRQELEALYRADEELYRHLRLDEVLQALVDIAVNILQADKSSLSVWDDDRREKLVVRAARGFRSESLAQMTVAPGDGTTVGHVAATGEPAIVQDTRVDPRFANRASITAAEGIRSSMNVPIKIGGELFGVFSVDYVQPHAFGSDEQRLYIALAQRAALPIQNAQLYEQAQELAVVEERSRLARDLHDAVTQTLFSASLIAEALPPIWENDRDEGRQLLAEMRRLSRGALAEMRALLLELRPAAVVEASLGDLLRQLAEAVTGRKDVSVTVTVEGECELPSDVHVALYRIAQEALNNAVKHAQASQVEIGLRCETLIPAPSTGLRTGPSPWEGEGADRGRSGGLRVRLCIGDDGCGFDPSRVPPDRLGLCIMRERAQAVGARLAIESEPGHGTQIAVVWRADE